MLDKDCMGKEASGLVLQFSATRDQNNDVLLKIPVSEGNEGHLFANTCRSCSNYHPLKDPTKQLQIDMYVQLSIPCRQIILKLQVVVSVESRKRQMAPET